MLKRVCKDECEEIVSKTLKNIHGILKDVWENTMPVEESCADRVVRKVEAEILGTSHIKVSGEEPRNPSRRNSEAMLQGGEDRWEEERPHISQTGASTPETLKFDQWISAHRKRNDRLWRPARKSRMALSRSYLKPVTLMTKMIAWIAAKARRFPHWMLVCSSTSELLRATSNAGSSYTRTQLPHRAGLTASSQTSPSYLWSTASISQPGAAGCCRSQGADPPSHRIWEKEFLPFAWLDMHLVVKFRETQIVLVGHILDSIPITPHSNT